MFLFSYFDWTSLLLYLSLPESFFSFIYMSPLLILLETFLLLILESGFSIVDGLRGYSCDFKLYGSMPLTSCFLSFFSLAEF